MQPRQRGVGKEGDGQFAGRNRMKVRRCGCKVQEPGGLRIEPVDDRGDGATVKPKLGMAAVNAHRAACGFRRADTG
jgi:hypothetical protein